MLNRISTTAYFTYYYFFTGTEKVIAFSAAIKPTVNNEQ